MGPPDPGRRLAWMFHEVMFLTGSNRLTQTGGHRTVLQACSHPDTA